MSSAPTEPGTTTPTPTPTPQLPSAQPWEPGSGEVTADLKRAVTQVVEALGTVTGDASNPSGRLAEIGADPALANDAGTLIPPGEPAVTDVRSEERRVGRDGSTREATGNRNE